MLFKKITSDQSFGILLASFFLLLFFIHNDRNWKPLTPTIWVGASVLTIAITLIKPNLLTPLKKLWLSLGEALGKIVNPLILGLLFFFVITPFGIIRRMSGSDELRLRKKNESTYWITRSTANPPGGSFKNQF